MVIQTRLHSFCVFSYEKQPCDQLYKTKGHTDKKLSQEQRIGCYFICNISPVENRHVEIKTN